MVSLAESTKAALMPWVGAIVADACLRSAAAGAGVSVVELGPEHLGSVEMSIRTILAPVAPPQAIDQVIGQLKADSGVTR